MTLSTVTYLFKERELNLHGMSNTRRHKLSPLQKNLSNFLYITDLDDTIQKTHFIYIDKIYTNNKIDPDLHKNIYKIQKYNFKKFLLLKDDIKTIENSIQDLSDTNKIVDIQSPKIKKIKEFNLKRLNYLNNKLLNLSEQSMSPKVIIFLLRNQIFSLEIEKLRFEKYSSNKDYLSKYNRINLEVDKLIIEQSNIKNNHNNIIDTLNSRVQNLELEILNLEKIIDDERKKMEINSIKNLENKQKINWAKSKKEIKKLKKETGYNETLLENDRLNHNINLQEQQIKIKKLETKNVLNELYHEEIRKDIELENPTKEIEKKQKELEASNLNLINSNKVLDKLSEKLDLINNFSFSKDLVNTINNRNRNNKNNSLNSLNKDKNDFVSNNNNDLGKRKFSTLNLNKQNNNLDILKQAPKARKAIKKFLG